MAQDLSLADFVGNRQENCLLIGFSSTVRRTAKRRRGTDSHLFGSGFGQETLLLTMKELNYIASLECIGAGASHKWRIHGH